MDDFGSRLSTLLHERVPEPRTRMTGADIRELDMLPPARLWVPWNRIWSVAAAAIVIAALAALVSVLVATGVARHTAPAAPNQSLAPSVSAPLRGNCVTSQLQLTVGADQISDVGEYTTFHLNNTGSDACLMQGPPSVQFLDDLRNPVAWPISLAGSAGDVLTVPAGGYSEFSVNEVTTACGSGDARADSIKWIQVDPPGQDNGISVPFRVTRCASVSLTATSLGGVECENDVEASTSAAFTSLDGCQGFINRSTQYTVSVGDES